VRFLRRTYFTFRRWAVLTAALLGVTATAGVGSASAAWSRVAIWEMNETSGTTMRDTSGHKRNAHIGSLVNIGVPDGTRVTYEWPSGTVNESQREERLVTVTNTTTNRAFNPRRDPFAVTLWLKTDQADQNIIQKGQATTSGGNWKIETNSKRATCFFRGSAGRGAVTSRIDVADGNWHTVKCIRRRTGVTIIVDDSLPRTEPGRTGLIANSWPLTIGGKWRCGGTNVSCQDYVGRIDRIVISRYL
jgi:hypothetical protein